MWFDHLLLLSQVDGSLVIIFAKVCPFLCLWVRVYAKITEEKILVCPLILLRYVRSSAPCLWICVYAKITQERIEVWSLFLLRIAQFFWFLFLLSLQKKLVKRINTIPLCKFQLMLEMVQFRNISTSKLSGKWYCYLIDSAHI